MIYLIHGDNTTASREEFHQLKAKMAGKEIRDLSGKSVDLAALTQALESGSMFGGDTAVFIDNLFGSLGLKIKLCEQYAEIIRNAGDSLDIVLWEEKEIGKTVQNGLGPKIINRMFKLPVLIFNFLDGIRPDNVQSLLMQYQKLKETAASELIFAMIIRRFRQLVMLRDNVMPEGLQEWQAARLTTQAEYFSMEQLTDLYQKLINIEYLIKSGLSPYNFDKQLELFLVDL
jgi:DNA polymerase III delta subunit